MTTRPLVETEAPRAVGSLATSVSAAGGARARNWSSFAWAREYWLTFVTEFVVLVGQLLVYRFAAHLLGKFGFAEYAVARRTVAMIQPVLTLGLNIALPRYTALANGRGEHGRPKRMLAAALCSIGSMVLVCNLILVMGQKWFAFLTFGSESYASLIPLTGLMASGIALHAVAYSFFRGNLAMRKANLLQIVNSGLIPPLVLLLFGKSINGVLLALGLSWIGISGVVILFQLNGLPRTSLEDIRELLKYGLQRVPGDVLYPAMLALPAVFAAHTAGVRAAGYLAFSISIMSTIAAMFAPVSIILLPKASRLIGEGSLHKLRSEIVQILQACVLFVLGIIFVLEVFARPLIRVYLGQDFGEVAFLMRVVVPGALPLVIIAVLRGLIDAYYRRAVNTQNLIIGVGVFLVLSAASLIIFHAAVALPLAMITGISVTAFLTVREAYKIMFQPSGSDVRVG